MKLAALALTAGLGTRLRPHTLLRAKPAIPFLGVPLALHALRHLEPLQPQALTLNLHYRPDDIRSLDIGMLHLPTPGFSDETKLILGSGGALNLLMKVQKAEHYLLCNGDEVLLPERSAFLKEAFELHMKENRLATLVTMKHPEVGHTLGGAWTDKDLTVKCFSKKPVDGLLGQHYVGYLFLAERVRRYMKPDLSEENILYHTLTAGMNQGELVKCHNIESEWFETGETPLFIKSTELALDILEKRPNTVAAKDLRLFLSRFASFQTQVEKENAAVLRRLQHYLENNSTLIL